MTDVFSTAARVLQLMDLEKKSLRDAFYNSKGIISRLKSNEKDVKKTFALALHTSTDAHLLKQSLANLLGGYEWTGHYCPVADDVLGSGGGSSTPKEDAKGAVWSFRKFRKTKSPQKKNNDFTFEHVVFPYLCLIVLRDLLLQDAGLIKSSEGYSGRVCEWLRGHLAELKSVDFAKSFVEKSVEKAKAEKERKTSASGKKSAEKESKFLRVNFTRTSTIKVADAFGKAIRRTPQFSSVYRISGDMSEIMQHPLVTSGAVVVQDLACCTSPLAAGVAPGDCILDACAAPGNKSIHVLDLLRGQGRLILLDNDLERAKILLKRVKLAGQLEGPFLCPHCRSSSKDSWDAWKRAEPLYLTNAVSLPDPEKTASTSEAASKQVPKDRRVRLIVEIRCANFTSLTEEDFKGDAKCECESRSPHTSKLVETPPRAILLDPSCSGSGIHRLEGTEEILHPSDPAECKRVQTLAAFQTKLLCHAMDKFPSSEAVNYSTCSIYPTENELVVASALAEAELPMKVSPAFPLWQTTSHASKREAYVSKLAEMLEKKNSSPTHASKRRRVEQVDAGQLYDACFHSGIADSTRGFFLCKLQR